MHIYLDGPKFLSEEQLEKNTKYAYAKTMLHAEFFCNILCCDFFLGGGYFINLIINKPLLLYVVNSACSNVLYFCFFFCFFFNPKKNNFFVVFTLALIEFGRIQISMPKIGMLLLKMVFINPWLLNMFAS